MARRAEGQTPGPATPLATLVAALGRLPALAQISLEPRATLGGAWGASAALVCGLLSTGRTRSVALAPTAEDAESLLLDLATAFPQLPLRLLPVEEEGLADGPELAGNRSERLVALSFLAEAGAGLLVVPGPVLLERLPEPSGEGLTLRRGDRPDRATLLEQLAAAGLQRVPLVAAPGEWSLRGDILDIYPWAAENPIRAELLDDEIEELRRFDVETQCSVASVDQVTLPLGGAPSAPKGARLVDLFPSDAAVFVLDPPRLKDRLAEVAFEHGLAPREITAALSALAERPGLDLLPLDLGDPARDLSLRSVGGDPRPAEDVLATWQEQGRQVLVLGDTAAEGERLAERLSGPVEFYVARLSRGFAFPGTGPVLVHHHELLGRRPVRRTRARRVLATRALDNLAELHPGDAVVHLLHGVARFVGLERLAREQGEEDFLVLEFAEETRLFVPASRIDLVERFVGAEARGPRLDRIGGRTWRNRKEKVARAVRDLAAELLALQAARQGGRGFQFPGEDDFQRRFEAAFPYEDTPDQSVAWSEVRRDMEGERPMDRLLVGDVGFGKTEIAVRAAFKAVAGGKQVAVLVPTTILAEQHYDTFSRRMAEEAVVLQVLSRFRGDKEQQRVLEQLAVGKVDIVIGTHRLLGKDVRFHDMGLAIVDEEQRFGVAHKERLKQLRATVDVLTLSATPIPRTLHMAMSGLRDISTIKTPPPGRRPVLTKVGYDEDGALRQALLHEIGRGGQVFVLHNRVQSIGTVLARIRALVPTARTALAHGQMGSDELREVIETFARGELDVLVCTAIIESGIDIPRANTIIVTDSHHFGLADMHQLRGRVGREHVQAYAHFLVPRDPPLAEDAQRRLKAIEEFSSLGSGLPIALRDLELRGAGNLLGAEQSGHIMAVGYDMYCRLLRNAVLTAKGERVPEEPGEIEVELGLTAFLPADYVPEESLRMSLLRRLAAAGAQRLQALEAELQDRFGRLPRPAAQLIELFRLRRLVRLAGLSSVQADGLGGVIFTVADERAWARRGPFDARELGSVSPGRVRTNWPSAVREPADRLRWLLERFEASAARTARAAAPSRR
ncbi:MAG: transcription-repair coupling factor [Planctomycetota bacterium]